MFILFILLKSYTREKKGIFIRLGFILNIVSISSKIKFKFLGQISSYTNLLSCYIWNRLDMNWFSLILLKNS